MSLVLGLGGLSLGGGSGGGATVIGGIAVGAAGTGIYSGYTMVGGDDFNGSLDIVTRTTPKGKYPTTRGAYLTSTTDSFVRGSPGLAGYDFDTVHTGHTDQRRGASLSSVSDLIAQSGSFLTLKSRIASASEQAMMYDPTKPLASSMIHGAAAFQVRAPCMLECYMQFPTGTTSPTAWHPTFWVMMNNPISRSANDVEVDWEAGTGKTMAANYVLWNGSGSGSASSGPGFSYTNNFRLYTIEFTATQVVHYLDGVERRRVDIDVASYGRNSYFLLTNHALQAQYDATAATEWASAGSGGALMKIDYVRYWRATAGVDYVPLTTQADINVASGGSINTTLGTIASVWGDAAATDVVEACAVNFLEPGGAVGAGYDNLPSPISYNSGTRVLSGSPTTPGRLHMVRSASKSGGSSCVPQRFSINVGPTLPAGPLGLLQGSTLDLYALVNMGDLIDLDSGDPKKITVSGLPSGVSYSSATGLLTATGGATTGAATITVGATNIVGQTISASITLNVNRPPAAGTAYTSWVDTVGLFDADQAGDFDASSGAITSWANRISGAGDLAVGAGGVTRSTNNGPVGGAGVVSDGATNTRMEAANGTTLADMIDGTDTNFQMIFVFKPAVVDQTGWLGGWSKTIGASSATIIGALRRATGSNATIRYRASTTAHDISMVGTPSYNAWHILVVRRQAGKLSVWLDSYATPNLDEVAVTTETTANDAGAVFSLFNLRNTGASDPTYGTGQTFRGILVKAIISPPHSTGDIEQTISALGAEYGITLI